jgi:hypothetical protein
MLVLAYLATAIPVSALCLDPKTFLSGYHLPLSEELHSASHIVIGNVTKETLVQDDASDPKGVSAYVYTIQIVRQLKGHLPRSIHITVENNSGRYPMVVGERHLLFLNRESGYFSVNSCGNSSVLPKGNTSLRQVEALVARVRNAPLYLPSERS